MWIVRVSALAIVIVSNLALAGPATQPTIAQRLDERVTDMNLEGLTLPEAFVKIADKTRLNIIPEWSSLEGVGVDRETKLHGHIMNVTAKEVIQLALSEAGATEPPVLVVDGNLLRLSRPPRVITRAYPVGRIADSIVKSHPPTTQPADAQRSEAIDEIIKMLSTTVAPESWRDAGGTLGAVSRLGRQLIVTQTAANHKQIEELLRKLDADAK